MKKERTEKHGFNKTQKSISYSTNDKRQDLTTLDMDFIYYRDEKNVAYKKIQTSLHWQITLFIV